MSFEHHIFVDFENIREADLDLLDGHSAALTLVLGRHQKTVTLTMVEALRRLPPEQVTLVQSAVPGKNSLDFVLACLVGRAVEGHPGVSVHIVSRDKGFDALIAHLRERGIAAARHETLAAVPVLGAKDSGSAAMKPSPVGVAAKPPAAKKAPKVKPLPPLEERVELLAHRLTRSNSSRPQKRSTLVTYIKNQLPMKMTDRQVKETIDGLVARFVFSITPAGKVVYVRGDEHGEDEDVVPF